MIRSLPDLIEGWVQDVPGITTTGISLDVRTIKADEAFVAVQGQLNHGLDFAEAAVDAGAAVIIHDGLVPVSQLAVPTVCVPHLGRRLGELASRFYAAPSELMSIAAVAGINGRTPVAHFLAQSWQRVYGNAGLLGPYGYGPLKTLHAGADALTDSFQLQKALVDCLDADIEHVAMEVSSTALQHKVIETVQIDAAIFTDLGDAPMSDGAIARRELLTDYAPAFAIINHDDSQGRHWFSALNGGMEILSFGLDRGAELHAEIRCADRNGMVLRINGPWGAEDVRTGLLGESNASSLLATAGALCLLGMPWHRVLNQLELMQPVPAKMLRAEDRPRQRKLPVRDAQMPDAMVNVA